MIQAFDQEFIREKSIPPGKKKWENTFVLDEMFYLKKQKGFLFYFILIKFLPEAFEKLRLYKQKPGFVYL